MAALNSRFRPRFGVFRLRGFSLIFGMSLNYIERDSEFSIAESRGWMAHLAGRVHLAWREPSGRSPDRATPGC